MHYSFNIFTVLNNFFLCFNRFTLRYILSKKESIHSVHIPIIYIQRNENHKSEVLSIEQSLLDATACTKKYRLRAFMISSR